MNSLEKINTTLDQAELMLESPDLTHQARMALSTLVLARDHISAMLPEDPDEVDALLEHGSGWLLSLRSDERATSPAYDADATVAP